jgi:hypothetical protein
LGLAPSAVGFHALDFIHCKPIQQQSLDQSAVGSTWRRNSISIASLQRKAGSVARCNFEQLDRLF